MTFDLWSGRDNGHVLDRSTGERVPDVMAGDTDAGWIEVSVRDPMGDMIRDRKTGDYRRRRVRGSFLFIRESQDEHVWRVQETIP